MKVLAYIFLFLSSAAFCQSLFNLDTINKMDAEGKKQGRWIILGKLKPGSCYKEEQKVEEGRYINNRKTGVWMEYYCNGNLKNKLTFFNGRPEGEATMYFENGKISETGTWKINRWVGNYKLFDSLGQLVHEYTFDPKGRRVDSCGTLIKTTPYYCRPYYDYTNPSGKSKPQNIDSTGKKSDCFLPPCDGKSHGPIILNGKHILYNKNRQVTKDGFFQDNKFMNGKAYFYDDNYILTRVAVYKNGVYVGDTMIER